MKTMFLKRINFTFAHFQNSYHITQLVISMTASPKLSKKFSNGFPTGPNFPMHMPKATENATNPRTLEPSTISDFISHNEKSVTFPKMRFSRYQCIFIERFSNFIFVFLSVNFYSCMWYVTKCLKKPLFQVAISVQNLILLGELIN